MVGLNQKNQFQPSQHVEAACAAECTKWEHIEFGFSVTPVLSSSTNHFFFGFNFSVAYVDIVIFVWIFMWFVSTCAALQIKWHIIGCCYCCLLKTRCTWSLIVMLKPTKHFKYFCIFESEWKRDQTNNQLVKVVAIRFERQAKR